MSVQAKQYAEALYDVLKKTPRENEDEKLKNFSLVLRARGHRYLLSNITRCFFEIVQKSRRARTISIVSARPLTEKEKKSVLTEEAIKKFFSIQNRIEQFTEDPGLIGGYVVQSREARIDESYKAKCIAFYKHLMRS